MRRISRDPRSDGTPVPPSPIMTGGTWWDQKKNPWISHEWASQKLVGGLEFGTMDFYDFP